MTAPLTAIAEAAVAYCATVSETTATWSEMRTGGAWVSRLVELRDRKELAYVELARSLRAAGYVIPKPEIDESEAARQRRQRVYDAEEAGWETLSIIRTVAAGKWPPEHPAPAYLGRLAAGRRADTMTFGRVDTMGVQGDGR